MWRLLRICDNGYKLENHFINQSCPCQARVLLLLLKGPRHRIKGQDAQWEILKWASIATRESLIFVHANNKGSGLSSYPRSLISAFIVHLLESIISELAYCKISFLACLCSWTDWFETYSVRNLQDSFLAGWPLKCILPLILTRKTLFRRQVCGM